ncbi:methionine--tRNA ligase [Planctomycetaceae bacterium SCGC AG-212-F19]|nr:methionine--tRNA ligase [Planctomycetaceae bacterium SCGC AG-212-F19]
MAERKPFYQTTAIDYPNSRPHIGTAFEKIGADVQARYRRMEGYDVHFLMGNDENTVKVAKKAAELGQDVQAYCNDMAGQFKEVWQALEISYDEFVQTSEPRHHRCARHFIQKVFDNGHIYKGSYEGWYCDGCESFKTETDVKEHQGICPSHKTPYVRRGEPCYFFAQSKFQDRLLQYFEENPSFIQPESRRNEMLKYVQGGLEDVNITRSGQSWGIKVPFDETFTIWVWFDALLTYFTGIGYASDDAKFAKWWPADIHFIGKDITRFHCALWPAMLFAAGLEPPRMVFSHGFVYNKGGKISKSLGTVIEPMEVITKFSAEAFRYYFMRECPFPSDGDFTWERFAEVYNADLANNLGNLYSRCVTLIAKNYGGCLRESGGRQPGVIYTEVDTEAAVKQVQQHLEKCQYNLALEKIWRLILDPTNQYADKKEPWKLVKSDLTAAGHVLYDMVEQLRIAAILLKPFLPRSAETIYKSFNFPQSWDQVRYEDVWVRPTQVEDLRLLAALEDGKVKPLFPRIN